MTESATEQVRIVPAGNRRTSLFAAALASDWIMAVASPAVMLVAWELLVRSGALDSRFFPTPSSVVAELLSLLMSGELLVHLGWTLERVIIGFFLGAVPGVLLGVVMGLSAPLRAFLKPLLGLLRVVEFPGLTQRTPDRGMQSWR